MALIVSNVLFFFISLLIMRGRSLREKELNESLSIRNIAGIKSAK
jgi:hypothetical protein